MSHVTECGFNENLNNKIPLAFKFHAHIMFPRKYPYELTSQI